MWARIFGSRRTKGHSLKVCYRQPCTGNGIYVGESYEAAAAADDGSGAGTPMRDKSSLMTSWIFRMGSPRITFFTSSMSSVSCSISARASYRMCDETRTILAEVSQQENGSVRTRCSSCFFDRRRVKTRAWPACSNLDASERSSDRDQRPLQQKSPYLRTSLSISSRLLVEIPSS